ncbi:hypothetical protein HGRIS_004277 [Hohenbuehelia grisea]|uniref:Uncharacterized protein n=1 Tax=Hohenbuehelia grisea TaxID=104357 RepID=A0ABR3IPB3_9AGAR
MPANQRSTSRARPISLIPTPIPTVSSRSGPIRSTSAVAVDAKIDGGKASGSTVRSQAMLVLGEHLTYVPLSALWVVQVRYLLFSCRSCSPVDRHTPHGYISWCQDIATPSTSPPSSLYSDPHDEIVDI